MPTPTKPAKPQYYRIRCPQCQNIFDLKLFKSELEDVTSMLCDWHEDTPPVKNAY